MADDALGGAFFDNIKVVSENLCDLNADAASISERKAAHLDDLASLTVRLIDKGVGLGDDGEAVEDGFINDAFVEAYHAGFPSSADSSVEKGVNNEALKIAARCSEVYERAVFCRLLTEKCEKRFMTSGRPFALTEMLLGGMLGESDLDTPKDRVSYLRSSYTDSAYSMFAHYLSEPTVMYSRDFNGVCEDVYYGRAGRCILPIENSTDGTLVSFRNLILKYELKIACTCGVGIGGYSSTKFALLSRELVFPKSWDVSDPEFGISFEFRVSPHDETSLAPMLMAAVCLGLRPVKLESVPAPDGSSSHACDIVCRASVGSLDPFILYLLLEAPGFEAVGIYPHLGDAD